MALKVIGGPYSGKASIATGGIKVTNSQTREARVIKKSEVTSVSESCRDSGDVEFMVTLTDGLLLQLKSKPFEFNAIRDFLTAPGNTLKDRGLVANKDQKAALIIMPLFLLLMAWIGYKVIFDPENASQKAYEKAVRDEREAAIQVCRDAVRGSANHPSTVDFSWDSYAEKLADQSWAASVEFRAKNSFGLELSHRASCLVNSGQIESFSVKEI